MKKALAGLKSRSFRVGGYSVAASVIVIAIALVINLLVGSLPSSVTQIDVTANGMYSLSEETKNLLAGLNEDIDIYWVVQGSQESDTLGLLLDRYAGSGSHITVTKKDPDVSPTFVQQYFSGGIYNNSLVVVGANGRSRAINYSDIFVYDYSNYYTTGSYDVSFNGEAEITSAIAYITSGSLGRLYTLTGHGEGTLSSTFQNAIEKQNMEVESLSLLTMSAVPEDADCILIYNPTGDISADEADMLQAYLDGGGHLFLITDPLAEGSDLTRLEALLNAYGVRSAGGIVIEGDQNYYYGLGYPYYLLPKIDSHEITEPLTSGNYYVLLPIADGLTVDETLPEGVSVSPLLSTSDSAFLKTDGYAATTYEKEDGDKDGPFTLAAAIEDENTGARAVWVSSAALVDDTANSYVSGGNQDLFLNCLSWMAGQEDSLSIHAKSVSTEYLTMSSSAASLYTVLIIFLIPLLFLSIGIVIVVRRKRR